MTRQRARKACTICGSLEHTKPRCPTFVTNVPAGEDRAPPPLESGAAPDRSASVDGQQAPDDAPATGVQPASDAGEKSGAAPDSSGPTPEEQKAALEALLSVAFGQWSAALGAAGAFDAGDPMQRKARAAIDATAAKLCAEVAVQFGWIADSKWMNLLGATAMIGVSYGVPTYYVLRDKRARERNASGAGPALGG